MSGRKGERGGSQWVGVSLADHLRRGRERQGEARSRKRLQHLRMRLLCMNEIMPQCTARGHILPNITGCWITERKVRIAQNQCNSGNGQSPLLCINAGNDGGGTRRLRSVLALSEDNQVGDPFDIMRRVNRAIYRHRHRRRRYSERDNQTVA